MPNNFGGDQYDKDYNPEFHKQTAVKPKKKPKRKPQKPGRLCFSVGMLEDARSFMQGESVNQLKRMLGPDVASKLVDWFKRWGDLQECDGCSRLEETLYPTDDERKLCDTCEAYE